MTADTEHPVVATFQPPRTNTAEPEHSSGWCINVLIGPAKREILGKMTASDARRVSACAGHFTIERVPLATMRPTIVLTLLPLTLVTTQACSGGAPTQEALETAQGTIRLRHQYIDPFLHHPH